MTFLNEKHLLFTVVIVEQPINLLERDKRVLLRGNEYARRSNLANQRAHVYFVNIEISLRHYDWLDVLIGDIKQNLREVCLLLAYLDKQFSQ